MPAADGSTALFQRVTSTYRLQLNAEFTFADAEAQVGYLADLGVSHLYLSPILRAVPGSMHGYDVLDHTRISPEMGGEQGLRRLAEVAHGFGLGVIADVVPNHMAFVAPESDTAPLWPVLREGRAAPTAHWFDIDWDLLGGRIGLPLLGSSLEDTIAAGELTLGDFEGQPVIRYHDHLFPIAPGTEPTGDAPGAPGDAGAPGAPDAPGALDAAGMAALLDRQHYLLAAWTQEAAVLNYRRFFAVKELIAVRVELPEVFEATHRVLLDLHHDGVIDGWRIDHPDGLADPEGYLAQLRETSRPGAPIWVEKILEGDEELVTGWATDGTTGYDGIRALQAALVDPAAVDVLDRTWAATGGEPDFDVVMDRSKRDVVEGLLLPEVMRLRRRVLDALPDADRDRMRDALVELLVSGEVYRAYLRPGEPVVPDSRRWLDEALARALAAAPHLAPELSLLEQLALGQGGVGVDSGAADDFAVRLQQTWGPVMAKGIEDTAFYRFNRMLALNEVGGDPRVIADASADHLHEWARRQQQDWPMGMVAFSTHDTKRSEDVRARLLALAGNPTSWEHCSSVFRSAASDLGLDAPTAHFIWQTLAGVGDISTERLHDYLTKSVREAWQHTAYTAPGADPDYEARVLAFADQAVADGPMRDAVAQAVAANADAIRATVLGGKLLQLTLPGFPDVYQGCEVVDLSLVDPDNRRAVDYSSRLKRLERLASGGPVHDSDALQDLDDEKLHLTTTALHLRQREADAFGSSATYEPLPSTSEHALGFIRSGRVAVLATRAPRRLADSGGWKDAEVTLPQGSWHDELTRQVHDGGTVAVAGLLASLPVALLTRR